MKSLMTKSIRFEVTVTEPITNAEFDWFEMNAIEDGYESALSSSGRILLIEGPENIHETIGLLAQYEFMEDIGLIKEIVDYEPEWEDEDKFIVEFE